MRALSLTSWFRVEDMPAFAVLSRATAFAVQAPRGGLLFLTSQHVTHPFLFKDQYYPDKHFLEAVSGAGMRWTVEVYGDDPEEPSFVWPMQAVARHAARDVAALRPMREAAFLQRLPGDLHVFPLAAEAPAELQPLSFEGHVTGVEDDDDPRPPLLHLLGRPIEDDMLGSLVKPDCFPSSQTPSQTGGHVIARTENQVFAHTEEVLEMGYCGGPVVDVASGACVGCVEGIVPQEVPGVSEAVQRLIAGTAVFVEAEELVAFVDGIQE